MLRRTKGISVVYVIEIVGSIGLILVGALLLWKVFRSSNTRTPSETIVIDTVEPKSDA